MYCPICGYFSFNPKKQNHPLLGEQPNDCHDPWNHYTEEQRKEIKMLPVTTENLFCGKCDKIFSVGYVEKVFCSSVAGIKEITCPHCFGYPLAPITESHLKAGENGGVVFLSGLAQETFGISH